MRDHGCRVKEKISITYHDCVFAAVVIQHVMRMRHIVLSCVACSAVCYFSTSSYKGSDFRKKWLSIYCVFGFPYNFYMKHFSV